MFLSRLAAVQLLVLCVGASAFGQGVPGSEDSRDRLELIADKLSLRKDNRMLETHWPKLDEAKRNLSQIIEAIEQGRQPTSELVIAFYTAIVDAVLQQDQQHAMDLKATFAVDLADAQPASQAPEAALHKWLLVAAQLNRTEAAFAVLLAETQRNEMGVARLDLVFNAIRLTREALLALSQAAFGLLPNASEPPNAAFTRAALLAYVELAIYTQVRNLALEVWEVEQRRVASGVRTFDQEALARERVFAYEAKVQEAKAHLILLKAPGSDELSGESDTVFYKPSDSSK